MTVIYVDEGHGSDSPDSARGSDVLPFRTLSQAYLQHSPDDEYKVKKANEDEYKPASKSALKKATSYAAQQQKKAANAANMEASQEALSVRRWRRPKPSRSKRTLLSQSRVQSA